MNSIMQNRKRLGLVAAVAVIALAAGCQPTYTDYSAFVREPRPVVTAKEYIIEPPDQILVQSRRVREIDQHAEVVSPNGTVNMPLVGEVFIAGLTAQEAAAAIQARATEYYEDADVNVRITAYASKKIFIFGEVGSAGALPYNGANTVLDTLAIAQPTRLADPSKIHILRPSPDGSLRKRMTVNLDKIVKEGDNTLDAVLEEGDIIYVPANGFAKVGLALQQVLLPVAPISQTMQAPNTIMMQATGAGVYGPSAQGNQ